MTRLTSTIILVFSTIFLLSAPPVSDARLPIGQSAEATSDWQSIAYLAYAGADRYKLAENPAPTSAPKSSPVSASPPRMASSPPLSRSPTASVGPSKAPSRSPAKGPVKVPLNAPSKAPSKAPSNAPGQAPGMVPVRAPIPSAIPSPPAPLVPTFGTPPGPPLLTTPPAPITLSPPPPVFGFQAINSSSTARSAAGILSYLYYLHFEQLIASAGAQRLKFYKNSSNLNPPETCSFSPFNLSFIDSR